VALMFTACVACDPKTTPDAAKETDLPAPPRIIVVRYSHVPGAHKIFKIDGTYSAGHLSGDPGHARVHHDNGSLKPGEREKIWAAAEAVDWASIASSEPAELESPYMELAVSVEGNRTHTLRWKKPDRPSDPKVTALVEIIAETRYGAW
jgi:hypothetical protein